MTERQALQASRNAEQARELRATAKAALIDADKFKKLIRKLANATKTRVSRPRGGRRRTQKKRLYK